MSTSIRTPDPGVLHRRFEDRLLKAWTAARDAVLEMEARTERTTKRDNAADEALIEKYRMNEGRKV